MTLKRIHREIADLKKEDLGAIVLMPSDDNLFSWKGSIPGPEGSVYEGGVFDFEVKLPPDYPCVLYSPAFTMARPTTVVDFLRPKYCSKHGRLH